MKTLVSSLLGVAGLLLTTLIVSQVWWYLWMNHDWFGTPRILHALTKPSGEESYDRTLDEMMIIVAIALFAAILVSKLIGRKRRANAS